MKKIVLMVFAFACVSLPVMAGPYFGIRGGMNDIKFENKKDDVREDEFEPFASGFVGVRASAIRLEAEYTYRLKGRYLDRSMELENQSVMGNLYLEPTYRSVFHPFIHGGAGMTFHKFKERNGSGSDTDQTFTWSAGVGGALEISKNVFIDVGYRYLDMGKPEFQAKEYHVTGQEVYAGIRLEF